VAVHVGGCSVLIGLVVDETSRVSRMDPVIHLNVVLAVVAFVAERPNNNGDVVPETVNKLFGPVKVGIGPFPIKRS
jgi:hypothetical protein